MKHLTLRNANILALYAAGSLAAYMTLHHFFVSATAQVQIVWTTLGVVGTAITASNLKDAIEDWRALKAAGRNGGLKVMANSAIRSETIRFSQMLAMVASGIVALQSSPTLTDAQRKALHIPEWTLVGVVVTGLLFWIVTGTVAQAYFERKVRTTFYHKDDNERH